MPGRAGGGGQEEREIEKKEKNAGTGQGRRQRNVYACERNNTRERCKEDAVCDKTLVVLADLEPDQGVDSPLAVSVKYEYIFLALLVYVYVFKDVLCT